MRETGLDMKLTHQRMTSRYNNTPESLTDWLEEQLECRGIDAVVYARYILSLLQENDSDSDDDNTSANSTADANRFRKQSYMGLGLVNENIKPMKTTNKWKHKRYLNNNTTVGGDDQPCDCWTHSGYCTHSAMNSDEERRLAVVQCLKSASEQEFGIESFVDELCAKLKGIKLLSETNDLSFESKADVANNNGVKVSAKEQAMKYYAAFPALDHNSNEGKAVLKAIPSVGTGVKVSKVKDKTQWNGQKIIEFITGVNGADGLAVNGTPQPTLSQTNGCPETEGKQLAKTLGLELIAKSVGNKQMTGNGDKKLIYCRDIESKVMQSSDSTGTSLVVDCNVEDNDKFERLVNKFNSNIASIWSKTGTETSSAKNDNIWSFDSSFSSNQSSATPSPKPNAIDFWSSMNISEINECLTGKRSTAVVDQLLSIPEFSWESNLLKSINAFPDDGFIDDNNDLLEDEGIWSANGLDKSCVETNGITLQNHQKNSPFIEFNSNQSNTKSWEKETTLELYKLLAMASLLKPKHPLSPSSDENLLTSPKTHFQPIRHDLFDESDEGSVADNSEHEVNKLVICSEKCPNNGDNKLNDNELAIDLRPVSTSFGELASIMGPFNDLDVNQNEFNSCLTFSDEIEFKSDLRDSEMSDKSTNTETESQIEVKTKLDPIIETSMESEPEYQDLFHMINEVLRNGISEDEPLLNGCSSLSALEDWYDSDFGESSADIQPVRSREKRLSWNCYWDTYDITSVEKSFANKSHFDIESNQLNEDICGEDMPNSYPLSQELSDNPNDTSDDVFAEELYFRDNCSHINGSLEECREYEEVFDEFGLQEETDFDFEQLSGVYGDSQSTDVSEYGIAQEMIGEDLPQFGRPFRLQLKPRTNAPKRNRKPCSFFVEGNCKRSDCKYSHDIGSITCKYWEEGFCFKADLCPFLHSYVDGDIVVKTKPKPTLKSKKLYTIESESDFPSLSLHPNSEESTPIPPAGEEMDVKQLKKHFFDFRTKSVADGHQCSASVSNAKLPIAVFMKKKVKKRKDRNLQ